MEHIHELLFDLVDQIKPQTSSNISRNSLEANIKSRHYKLNGTLSLVFGGVLFGWVFFAYVLSSLS